MIHLYIWANEYINNVILEFDSYVSKVSKSNKNVKEKINEKLIK